MRKYYQMPDSFQKTMRNFFLAMLASLVFAGFLVWLQLTHADVLWVQMCVPLGSFGLVSFVTLMSVGVWSLGREDADAQRSCMPIIMAFKATGDTDRLLYEYELWRDGEHAMATRIDFLKTVIELLIEAGYLWEAEDKLHELKVLSRSPYSRAAFRRFKQLCEQRMLALEAEDVQE